MQFRSSYHSYNKKYAGTGWYYKCCIKNAGWISKSLPFFTNATWARMTVIIVNLWIGIPYTILQVTGILQNIPMELYEAADVTELMALSNSLK